MILDCPNYMKIVKTLKYFLRRENKIMLEVANLKYYPVFNPDKVILRIIILVVCHKVEYFFYSIEKSNVSKLSIVFRNPKGKSIFAFQPKLFICETSKFFLGVPSGFD